MKINVHSIEINNPQPGAIVNSVGVVIRKLEGDILWGAMGPFNDCPAIEAHLKEVHAGIVQAVKKESNKVHLETDNLDAYDILMFQDKLILEDNIQEVIKKINTLVKNKLSSVLGACKMSSIPKEHNTVAAYLASYGLEHMNSFAAISSYFGNLYELVKLNMGWGPLSPTIDPVPNFGRGEILNTPLTPVPTFFSEASMDSIFNGTNEEDIFHLPSKKQRVEVMDIQKENKKH